jgi:hypothetical protein
MSFTIYYQELVKTVAAGQISEPVYTDVKSMAVLSASADLEIAINDYTFSPFRTGLTIEAPDGESIKIIRFKNNGGSTGTVELALSKGKIADNRFTTTSAVEVRSGDSISTPASGTAVSLGTATIAANTARNAVLIQNHSTTEYLWVGDSNVGNDAAPRGFAIAPKGILTLAISAALFLRRGGSSDVTYTYGELS